MTLTNKFAGTRKRDRSVSCKSSVKSRRLRSVLSKSKSKLASSREPKKRSAGRRRRRTPLRRKLALPPSALRSRPLRKENASSEHSSNLSATMTAAMMMKALHTSRRMRPPHLPVLLSPSRPPARRHLPHLLFLSLLPRARHRSRARQKSPRTPSGRA